MSLATADEVSLQAFAQSLGGGQIATASCGSDGAGHCLTNTDGLGVMIETRFKAIEGMPRTGLTATRNLKACEAKEVYPNAPHIGDLACSMVTPPDPETGEMAEDTTGTESGGTEASGTEASGDTTGDAPGDCCMAHAGPGCENPAVEMCVCAQDDLCCAQAWDEVCVSEVNAFGCGTC